MSKTKQPERTFSVNHIPSCTTTTATGKIRKLVMVLLGYFVTKVVFIIITVFKSFIPQLQSTLSNSQVKQCAVKC